jgi:uncharacterized metal-binding protein
MENMCKMFEEMQKQDSGQMAKMMEMCQSMFKNGFDGNSCNCEDTQSNINSETTTELELLFMEWLNQIKGEINQYRKEKSSASTKELADYFKLTEQSIEYIINSVDNKKEECEYTVLNIKKTQNSCSLCEDYVKKNQQKPIIIASCEGACLRGEISRKVANQLCHSIAPDRTVRLCLGSALTKEAGQRSLVDKADKLLVLEGCPVDCASRMLCGLSENIHPEVIHTDVLADFDKCLFGIDEMSEDDINKLAYSVACKIAENL